MYFDPVPKTRREDLFGREDELRQFQRVLQYTPLIIITGLRRTGKTSFLNVALAESGAPHIRVDLRGLPVNPSRKQIIQKLQKAFNSVQGKWKSRIQRALEKVRGVKVLGAEISLAWEKDQLDLVDLFERIDAWTGKQNSRFIVAFDEFQHIRGDRNVIRILAYIMDNLQHIAVVVTGSEVGLLYDFLKLDSPGSVLYGRHHTEIRMRRFTSDEANEFLRKGFEQVGIQVSEDTLTYAVDKLDGIVGWLTEFGAHCRDCGRANQVVVDETMDLAGRQARDEITRLVAHSKRYGVILNYLANVGTASWSQLKRVLEAHEGRQLPSYVINEVLKRLTKMSIIGHTNNQYQIMDPLLRHGIFREPLPQ
ncbi:MAG: AAA family ATPase [Candidatus Thorarchaeota archaeon]